VCKDFAWDISRNVDPGETNVASKSHRSLQKVALPLWMNSRDHSGSLGVLRVQRPGSNNRAESGRSKGNFSRSPVLHRGIGRQARSQLRCLPGYHSHETRQDQKKEKGHSFRFYQFRCDLSMSIVLIRLAQFQLFLTYSEQSLPRSRTRSPLLSVISRMELSMSLCTSTCPKTIDKFFHDSVDFSLDSIDRYLWLRNLRSRGS
jgi:hypothetical protein